MSNISGDTFFIENSVNCSDLGSINGQVTFIDTSKNCGQVLNAIFSGNGVCNEGQAYGCTVFCNSSNYGYICGTGILRGSSTLYGGADCVILCDQSAIDASAEVTDYNLLVNRSSPVNIYSLDGCYYLYSSGTPTLAQGAWFNGYYCSGVRCNFYVLIDGVPLFLAGEGQDTPGSWYVYSNVGIGGGPDAYLHISDANSFSVQGFFNAKPGYTGTSTLPVRVGSINGFDFYTMYISGSGYNILSGIYDFGDRGGITTLAETGQVNFISEVVDSCYLCAVNLNGFNLIQNSNLAYGKDRYLWSSDGCALIDYNCCTIFTSCYAFAPMDVWNTVDNYNCIKPYEVSNCTYRTPRYVIDNCFFYVYNTGIASLANGAYSNYDIISGCRSTLDTIQNGELPILAQDNDCYYYYVSGLACDPFLTKKAFYTPGNNRYQNKAYLREEDVPDFIEHADNDSIFSYYCSYGTGVNEQAVSFQNFNNPFINKNNSEAYFLLNGNGHYATIISSCSFSAPVAAGTDVYLNDLTSCAIQDKIFFTFNNGVGTLAVGAYSNGCYSSDGKICTTYNAATPLDDAQDDALFYTYTAGVATLASGPYSNGYYASGEISSAGDTATPVQAQDDYFYYTYSSGVATLMTRSRYGMFNVNNYIQTSAAVPIGTGDFTVEAFIKPTAINSNPYSTNVVTGVVYGSFTFGINYDYSLHVGLNGFAAELTSSPSDISLNKWHHIAAVREGGQLSIYINGIKKSTVPSSTDYGIAALAISHYTQVYRFMGDIANVRISNNARYSGNSFSVPLEPFNSDANTLQLALNDANFETGLTNYGVIFVGIPNWYDDSSSAARIGTLNGTLTQSDEGNGILAADFNGGNNYITTASTGSEFDFSSGDSTIEFWFKPTSSAFQYLLLGLPAVEGQETVSVHLWPGNQMTVNNGYTSDYFNISINEWQHLAIVISNNTRNIYLNGSLVATSTQLLGAITTLYIGTPNGYNNSSNYNGKIAGLRIVKGTALYTDNFSIPTTLLTDVAGTELLLNFGATAVPLPYVADGPYTYTYFDNGVPDSEFGIVRFSNATVCCGRDAGGIENRCFWFYKTGVSCCGFAPESFGFDCFGCNTRLSVVDTYCCTISDTCSCCTTNISRTCNAAIDPNSVNVLVNNKLYCNILTDTPYIGAFYLCSASYTCWACEDLYNPLYCTCNFDVYCTCTYDVYNTEDPPVCIGQDTCQVCCGSDSCQVCCGQECCGSQVICDCYCNISCVVTFDSNGIASLYSCYESCAAGGSVNSSATLSCDAAPAISYLKADTICVPFNFLDL